MKFLLGLGLILCLTRDSLSNDFVINNHVVFRHVKRVSTSQAQWNLALVIDLDGYKNFLSGLQEQTQRISDFINLAKTHFISDKITNVIPLENTLVGFQNYLENLNASNSEALLEYEALTAFIHSTPRVQKRSLLPFGGLFSFLFGTASDKDLNAIRSSVTQLAKSQRSMLHIMEHNLSIINATRLELAQNRETINGLITSLQSFQEVVTKQLNRYERLFLQLKNFHEISNAIRNMLSEIKHLHSRAYIHLTDFKLKLNLLSLEKLSPSLITAQHFREILNHIQDQIPNNFVLPLDTKTQLLQFYESLRCSTVNNGKYLAIIMHIPLMPVNEVFTLVKATPITIPYSNDSMPVKFTHDSSLPSARIELESSYFLINDKRSHYMLLSDVEANTCLKNKMAFCEVTRGFSSIYKNKLCIILSYINEVRDSDTICQKIIVRNEIFPQAEILNLNHWLIMTDTSMHLTVKCLNGSHHVFSINDRVSKLIMPPMCEGFSNRLFIPLYYNINKSTKLAASYSISLTINISGLSLDQIWKPFHEQLKGFKTISLPPKLKAVKKFPIGELIDQVKFLQSASETNTSLLSFHRSIWPFVIILALIVLVIGMVFFCYVRRKGCFKSCKNKSKLSRSPKAQSIKHSDLADTIPLREANFGKPEERFIMPGTTSNSTIWYPQFLKADAPPTTAQTAQN